MSNILIERSRSMSAGRIRQRLMRPRAPHPVQVARGASTATKTNTPIIDIPQSISILTKQQLEDRGSLSVQQALTYVPGVTVTGGEGNKDAITIRGQSTSPISSGTAYATTPNITATSTTSRLLRCSRAPAL